MSKFTPPKKPMMATGPRRRRPGWAPMHPQDERTGWAKGLCGCGGRLVTVQSQSGEAVRVCSRSGWSTELCGRDSR